MITTRQAQAMVLALTANLALLATLSQPVHGDDTPRPASRPPSESQRQKLHFILQQAVDSHTVPGASLLLAHRGKVVFKEAFGNLTLDAPVLMASSAKPVTATVIMILVDQHKLDLDDPIAKYLPEFQTIKLGDQPPARPPTLRHVLSNTSGLPGDPILGMLRDQIQHQHQDEPGKAAYLHRLNELAKRQKPAAQTQNRRPLSILSTRNSSLADSVRALAEGGLETEPGAEFHYCTLGFNVAARVAEVATGQPFEELAQKLLFDPLGMTHTRYIAFGPARLGGPRLKNGESRFIIAGGGMISTLDDFFAFYELHRTGGLAGRRRILSQQAILQMHTSQVEIKLGFPVPFGNHYGLSFFLNRLDANRLAHEISHPGLFGTTPWLDRDRNLVGILLVQSNFMRVLPLVQKLQSCTQSDDPPLKP